MEWAAKSGSTPILLYMKLKCLYYQRNIGLTLYLCHITRPLKG